MAIDPDKGEEKKGKRQGNDNGKQNARGGRPRDGRPAGKVATGSSELGSGGPHNNGLQKQAEASASRLANADDKAIKRSQPLSRGASQKVRALLQNACVHALCAGVRNQARFWPVDARSRAQNVNA